MSNTFTVQNNLNELIPSFTLCRTPGYKQVTSGSKAYTHRHSVRTPKTVSHTKQQVYNKGAGAGWGYEHRGSPK